MTAANTTAKAAKVRRPIWPKVPAAFVRAVLAGHSALGLAFAALIFLVCFSGSAAVFIQEVQRWERPQDPVVREVSAPAIQNAFREGLRLTPDTDRVVINLPGNGLPRYTLTTWKGRDHTQWSLDAEGRPTRRLETPWTEFVQDLHIYLHLPQSWGMFVVGLTGVALLSSLVSGVLAHPRVFRDAFHLRWGGSKRLQEADLHNRLGVWGLPFHVLLSLTGSLLGLATIIVGVLAMVVFKGDTEKAYALFATPEPAHDASTVAPVDLTPMLATVARVAPEARITYAIVEDPRKGEQHISFGIQNPRVLAREIYSFDRHGVLLGGTGYGARNLGEGLYSAIGSAHFGWFGGWASKIAYGVLGVALTVVTSSGVAIWLARRRAKGRPAPGWERVWVATAWSQPVAYGVAMLGSLVAPAVLPVVVWGVVTLAALATAARFDPARISRVLRGAGAVSLIASAGIHVLLWIGKPALDPAAWGMDVALVLLALALVAPETTRALRRRTQPPQAAEPPAMAAE